MIYYKGALDYNTLQNMSLSEINTYAALANKIENELKRAMKV